MASWAHRSSRTLGSTVESVSVPKARWITRERLIVAFWIAALATVTIMATVGPAGWDAGIYGKAIQSLRHGIDPYAAGIGEQEAFQRRPASLRAEHAPFTYVYSPLTLPLLRLLILLPDWLLAALLWAAVVGGSFLQLWAGFQFADERERSWLVLLLPAVAFFPGLITDDVILSGNVSYIIYGVVLAAAVPGWKRGRWFWFYAAVLAASVFKMQLLTLLAFPVLVGKRQWFPAAGTAAAGLAVVTAQAQLWPGLFGEYLTTIRIMFDLIPDFGYGPAGILGRFLWNQGLPYSQAMTLTYLVFGGAVGVVLLGLARRAGQEDFSREMWLPVALVGTFLLNPRIMKYDMAAITIPMLLIASRGLRSILQNATTENPGDSLSSNRALILLGAGCFLVPNLMTVFGPTWWPIELLALLTVFAMGVRSLPQPQVEMQPQTLTSPAELMELVVPEEIA